MNHKFFIAGLGLALSGAVFSQPTESFHLMRNTLSGKSACAQHPFSPDWVREAGPYKDQDCKIAEVPTPAPRTTQPANPLDLATPKASPKK